METKRVFIKSKNKSETNNTKTIYFDEHFINVKEVKLNSIQVHNSFHNISKSLGNNKFIFDIVLRSDETFTFNFTFKDGLWTDLKEIEKILNEALNSYTLVKNIQGKIRLKIEYIDCINRVKITHDLTDNEIKGFILKGDFLKLLGFQSNELIFPKVDDIPEFTSLLHLSDNIEDVAKVLHLSDHGVKLFSYTNLYVNCNLFDGSTYNGKRSDVLCSLPIDQSKRWWDTVTYNNLNCNFKPYKKDFNCIDLCITNKNGNHIDFNGYPIIYELEIVTETPKTPRYEKQLDEIIDCLKELLETKSI